MAAPAPAPPAAAPPTPAQLDALARELVDALQDLVYSADSVTLTREDEGILRPSANAARGLLDRARRLLEPTEDA